MMNDDQRITEASPKRLLEYEDLRRVAYLSAPAVAPDGRSALYVVQMAADEGSFTPRVRLIDLATRATRPLVETGMQNLPAFSPDGRLAAYIGRKTPSEEQQIWVVDLDTGIERQLTTLRHGVEEYCWSPDSRQIALTARWWPAEDDGRQFAVMSPGEKADWDFARKHSPIVIENLMYKFDETYGITDQSVSHVCLADLATGKVSSLTAGPVPHYRPSWSPDGRRLAWYGKPFRHTRENRPALFIYELESKELSQLDASDLLLDLSPAVFTADGRHLVFEAYVQKSDEIYMRELLRLQLSDRTVSPLFTGPEVCHGVDAMPTGRTALGQENPAFQLDPDGQYIYFLSGWEACENVYRLPVSGDDHSIEQVTDGKITVHSFCVPTGGKLLFTRGDLLTIAELYVMDLTTREQVRLTDSNPWLEEIALAVPEELWVDSTDGRARIHGFVVPPAVRKEGDQVPAVLDIHGGPECFYAHDFWFEFQMLAARGLAVVCCDPRGSSGYGAAFGSGEYAWAQESIDDLLAFLEAAIDKGFIDKDRIGVTGGSYGGHMTVRLIGSMNRFKAAVAQRILCNLTTSYGTGDMGFIWKAEGMQTQMQNFMSRAEKSPIAKIDRMKTPLLILHATHDYRCGFEQAEQLFIAMKDRNPEIPVRLVAFPGENHGMTRSGKAHFQITHLREMTRWFERFLKEDAGK